jgi:small GTP-binding protein
MNLKSTGIEILDKLFDHGLPSGKSMLLYTTPGIQNDVIGYQCLLAGIDGKSFCFISTTLPDLARRSIEKYGWGEKFAAAEKAGNFFFIDAISTTLGMPARERYKVDIRDVEKMDEVVSNSIKEVRGGIGLINSFSTIVDEVGADEALKLAEKWNKVANEMSVNLVYLFTAWEYPDGLYQKLTGTVNSLVKVAGIEKRVITGQYFSVMKADWTKVEDRAILCTILRPGGLRVYIPKLLVTGPYNAGKTSFTHSLATKSVSVDRRALEAFSTTVALDIGHVDYKTFSADIFGTPGQERFDLLLKSLGGEAAGVFVVIDSTDPKTFPRAKEMVQKCYVESVPKVIVANKQNLDGALKPEEIRERLTLGMDVPVIPVRAALDAKFSVEEFCMLNREDVYRAMDAMLDQIYS